MIFVFLCLTTQYDNLWVHSWHCIWHYFYLFLWLSDWTTRRSNQSILREISPGCSLEGMMLMRCLFFSCSHNSPAGLCFKILTCVITLIGFLQFFLNSLFPYWYFPGSTSQIDCLQSKTHFSVNF